MSSGRYWTGVVLGIIAGIISVIALYMKAHVPIIAALFCAYIAISTVSQLVWWEGPAVSVFSALLAVGLTVLNIPVGFIFSGNVILLLIGLFILTPCGSFFLACLIPAVAFLCFISFFTYFHNLFSLKEELY